MTKQEAVKKAIQESGWKKSVWIRNLNISRTQLNKWLSSTSVDIYEKNVVAVAHAIGKDVLWLDETYDNCEIVDVRDPRFESAPDAKISPHVPISPHVIC